MTEVKLFLDDIDAKLAEVDSMLGLTTVDRAWIALYRAGRNLLAAFIGDRPNIKRAR